MPFAAEKIVELRWLQHQRAALEAASLHRAFRWIFLRWF
jgi:hypothetical protein